jgi:hypothetical protein
MNRIIKKYEVNSAKIGVFLVSLAIFICFIPTTLPSTAVTYGLEHLHYADKNIFANNISVSSVSPRFFMNFIVAFCMNTLKFTWARSVFLLVYLTVLPYALAVTNIVYKVTSKNRLLYAIILSVFIKKSITAGLANISTFAIEVIALGMGSAFAALAISYCLGNKKKWDKAWILICIAYLFHVHEGMWGSVTIGLLYIRYAILNKKIKISDLKCMILTVVMAMICTIPSLISEKTNLSNAEFIDIYVNFRTAHHLRPSKWGWQEIIKYFLLLAYPVFFSFFYNIEKHKREQIHIENISFIIGAVAWGSAILVTYLTTEIVPIASMATMYFPKFLKYISFLAMIFYIIIIERYNEDNNMLCALVILLFALICKNIPAYLAISICLVVCILNYFMDKQYSKIVNEIIILCFAALLGSYLGKKVLVVIGLATLAWILIRFSKSWLNCKKYFSYLIVLVLLIVSMEGKVFLLDNLKFSKIEPTNLLIKSCSKQIYDVASAFKEKTIQTDFFVSDPNSEEACWFELISERNCYVQWKTVPSASSQIEEWYLRYKKTEKLFEKNINDIVSIMNDIDCQYILAPKKYFEKFDGCNLFEVYTADDEFDFRIYKLNEDTL